MKTNRFFIGNIKKCTNYETNHVFSNMICIDGQCVESESVGLISTDDEMYKENAILIRIKDEGYVDIDMINSFYDYTKVHKDITKNGFYIGGLIMSTTPHSINSLFVDENSLKPYCDKEKTKNTTLKKIKKQKQI